MTTPACGDLARLRERLLPVLDAAVEAGWLTHDEGFALLDRLAQSDAKGAG